MVQRSGVLIIILTFGVLFSLMYSSFQLYYVPPHDPDTIYIEPDVTQLQAVEIVEHEFRREVSGFDEAYLHFQYYNYSQELRNQEDYQQYLRSIRPGWPLSHVKEKPELLDLPLIFVHANGTHYRIDSDDQEFEKTCEEPSANCTLGSRGGEVARDRLVYELGAIVEGSNDFGRDIHYIIDAETGKVVYHIPYSDRNPLPPRFILDNRHTIKELNQIIENTKTGPAVEIVQNASERAKEENGHQIMRGYEPFDVRETLTNGTAVSVVWFNYDNTGHTVTSDYGYEDILGKKFDSGIIQPGDTFEFVFIEVGDFPYHCEIHPWMKGEVAIVEDFS